VGEIFNFVACAGWFASFDFVGHVGNLLRFLYSARFQALETALQDGEVILCLESSRLII